MTHERIETFIRDWVPFWIAVALGVSVTLHWLPPRFGWIGYAVAGITFLAALIVGMFHLISKPGARSFERSGGWLAWLTSWKGRPPGVYILLAACVIVLFVTGLESAPGLVTIACLMLLSAFAGLIQK